MPENKINAEGVISSFLDQIIAAKGENLSKNERLSLRQELFGELDDKINAAVIAALPDDKVLELNQKIDGNASEQEIEEFFAGAGIDFNKVALQVALQFRKDQLRDVPQAKVSAAEAGAPLQGTTSEAPGMSNVEGIARMVASMSEGGANA